jgi:hypothetical protein
MKVVCFAETQMRRHCKFKEKGPLNLVVKLKPIEACNYKLKIQRPLLFKFTVPARKLL